MDTSSVHRYLRCPCDKHSCRSLVTLKFESQANREEVFWSPTQSGKVYIRPLLSCYRLPRCIRLMLVAAVTVSQTHKVKGQLFLTSDARRWVDTVLFSQSFSPYQLNPGFIARFRSSSDFFFPSFLYLPDDAQYPFFFLPEDNTSPKLTVVRWTERGSHRVRPSPPCSHTWTTPISLFSPPSKQQRLCVVARIQSSGISCAVLCTTRGYSPVIKFVHKSC